MKAAGSRKRTIVVRSCLGAFYVAILVIMLLTGKRHTILIDNKAAEDASYEAVDGMSVQIDSLKSSEFYPGDRDKVVVSGQRHKVKVEIFNSGKVEERSFVLPLGQDMLILSVPKMLAGKEPWFGPFTLQQEQRTSTETTVEGGEMSFGGEVVDTAPVKP